MHSYLRFFFCQQIFSDGEGSNLNLFLSSSYTACLWSTNWLFYYSSTTLNQRTIHHTALSLVLWLWYYYYFVNCFIFHIKFMLFTNISQITFSFEFLLSALLDHILLRNTNTRAIYSRYFYKKAAIYYYLLNIQSVFGRRFVVPNAAPTWGTFSRMDLHLHASDTA